MTAGELVTAGGRVLNVTALGDNLLDAQRKIYAAIEKIHFDGMQFRTDIGDKLTDKRYLHPAHTPGCIHYILWKTNIFHAQIARPVPQHGNIPVLDSAQRKALNLPHHL